MTLDRLEYTGVQCFGLGGGDGFICTIANITPEKKAELFQRQFAHEAQERKKQQERFIDMISHEIRNPLSAILHCCEDILYEIHDKKMGQISLMNITESAETINLCITHQKKIVNDVLTFSKLDASMLSLSPRKVQPKRHLTTSLAIFRPGLRKQNIQFVLEHVLGHLSLWYCPVTLICTTHALGLGLHLKYWVVTHRTREETYMNQSTFASKAKTLFT